ncbi:MAG: GNAT family N-acetyltransferase [Streptosporangiaceae bacterium]
MVPVVTQLVQPTAAELADVATVFEQYRRHYGQPVVAGQALAWLTQYTRSGMLTIFTAHIGRDLVGIATTVVLPASLRLACSWQIRDLYVVPRARRHGAGSALVRAVAAAASQAGAIRLSIQTEPANTAALQLYRASGFVPVDDLHILSLDLPPSNT